MGVKKPMLAAKSAAVFVLAGSVGCPLPLNLSQRRLETVGHPNLHGKDPKPRLSRRSLQPISVKSFLPQPMTIKLWDRSLNSSRSKRRFNVCANRADAQQRWRPPADDPKMMAKVLSTFKVSYRSMKNIGGATGGPFGKGVPEDEVPANNLRSNLFKSIRAESSWGKTESISHRYERNSR